MVKMQQIEMFLAWLGCPLLMHRQPDRRAQQWKGQMLPVLAAVPSAGSQRDLVTYQIWAADRQPRGRQLQEPFGSQVTLLQAAYQQFLGSFTGA